MSFPTLKEELDRKTLETIEWLLSRNETGQMSEDQLRVGVDTAFNIVSGLVTEPIFQLISEASAEAGDIQPKLKKVFIRDDFTGVSEWKVGSGDVDTRIYKAGKLVKHRPRLLEDSKAAMAAFRNSAEVFKKDGWIEI